MQRLMAAATWTIVAGLANGMGGNAVANPQHIYTLPDWAHSMLPHHHPSKINPPNQRQKRLLRSKRLPHIRQANYLLKYFLRLDNTDFV